MTKLTKLNVALIAGGASVLTSAMHGTMLAIFDKQYDHASHVLAYVVGRVVGDIPLALICFGLAYALLAILRVQQE